MRVGLISMNVVSNVRARDRGARLVRTPPARSMPEACVPRQGSSVARFNSSEPA